MVITRSILSMLLAAWFSILPFAVCAEEILQEAQRLLAEGKGAEAYALLRPELERRAGEPEYDYVFGLAALEVGEPTQAVFAFERVLLVQPDHLQARAELARAYYLMGESGAARQEFERVKQEDVPPQVKETIDRYLAAMDYPYDPSRARLNVYLEFGGGYDSNVNSAADTSQVFIPATGIVTPLFPFGQEQDSGIGNVEGGFRFAYPLRSNLNLYGGGNAKWRFAFDATEFDQTTANGLLGLHVLHGANEYRFAALGQAFLLDGDSNRNLAGVNGQWQRNVNAQNQITLFGQAAALRFPGQRIRNANQYAGGLAWAHAFDAAGTPVALLSVFGGTEDNIKNRDDLGWDFVGARLGGQYSINNRATAFGAVTYQYSRYGGVDPLFGERRIDNYVEVGAGLRYAIGKNWSIRPEIGYTNNDSTLVINDYNRWQAMVFLRNDFF
ncbi:MAG: tetratricopeptide repeat protein [Gammaproteobacteria bacterium]|nr:tetratricopeptide repeat protein [Gammaproteobacteria bacterium]